MIIIERSPLLGKYKKRFGDQCLRSRVHMIDLLLEWEYRE